MRGPFVFALLATAAISLASDFLASALFALGFIALARGLKRSLSRLPFAAAAGLAAFVALQLIFGMGREEPPLILSVGDFALGLPALLKALAFPLRVYAYLGLFGALPAWLDEAGAARAAEELLSPLRRLGLRPEVASQAIAVALGFIPILVREARQLDLAMRARGGARGGKGLRARFKALAPIILPLSLGALDRAGRLALAMEARGFGAGRRSGEREPPGRRGRASRAAGLARAGRAAAALALGPTGLAISVIF